MKKVILALCLGLSLSLTSCLGPNNAMNSLRNWNAEATQYEWVNECIFLGCTILPVYSLFYAGDILIFNTIDYWGDENPISDPGAFPASWGNSGGE